MFSKICSLFSRDISSDLKKNYLNNYCESKYYVATDVDVEQSNIINFCSWLKQENVVSLSMRNLKIFKHKYCRFFFIIYYKTLLKQKL